MTIKTVTVIGANGVMGTNIAGVFASFGNAKVYLVRRDVEKSKQAAQKAAKSVRAGSIAKNLIPADYSELEACVADSDLVFESAAENLAVKLEVTKRIAAALGEKAIACSGTWRNVLRRRTDRVISVCTCLILRITCRCVN